MTTVTREMIGAAHDVALIVTGDFETPEQKREYAEEIARRLNGTKPVPNA